MIKDETGHPEYFSGIIRNHTHYNYIDKLTGLRNQYGFFEDLLNEIKNKREVRVSIIGISKLAEINAVHGYGLGNNVLQNLGRYLMDNVGQRSSTYRLDGSKFAVITENYEYDKVKKTYEKKKHGYKYSTPKIFITIL